MEHEYVHHAPGVKEHAVTHRYMRSSVRRITVGDYVTVVTHVRVSWFN